MYHLHVYFALLYDTHVLGPLPLVEIWSFLPENIFD